MKLFSQDGVAIIEGALMLLVEEMAESSSRGMCSAGGEGIDVRGRGGT